MMKTYKCEVVVEKHYIVYETAETAEKAGEKAILLIHDDENIEPYEYRDVHCKVAVPCKVHR